MIKFLLLYYFVFNHRARHLSVCPFIEQEGVEDTKKQSAHSCVKFYNKDNKLHKINFRAHSWT